MIEPEMAFCDIEQNMDLAEEMIRYLVNYAVENCAEDLELFSRFVDRTLPATLKNIVDEKFERLSYCEAIDILSQSGHSPDLRPHSARTFKLSTKGI